MFSCAMKKELQPLNGQKLKGGGITLVEDDTKIDNLSGYINWRIVEVCSPI